MKTEAFPSRLFPVPPRLMRLGVILVTSWGLVFLLIGAISEPTPENLILFLAVLTSGLYCLGWLITRPLWRPLLGRRAIRYAVLLSVFNAAVVESIFWAFERATGAVGVAAHPNLAIDLVLTMPWYLALGVSFVQVQNRQRFNAVTVLLLGAVYEFGADGLVGPLVGLVLGDPQILAPGYFSSLCLFGFWMFIPVYSSMVLPPAWLIESMPPTAKPVTSPWLDAIKPMLWLIPFTIYVLILVLLLSVFNLA